MGAVICPLVKTGLTYLYDSYLFDVMNLPYSMKIAMCLLLAILISVAFTLFVIRIFSVNSKSKEEHE